MATATPKKPKTSQPLKATTTASTAVAVKKASTSVVNIQDMLKAQAALMAGRTQPATGNMIRMKGKEFLLPDGTKTAGPLDLVIVDFASRNEFYENNFDKDNIVPPVCFAIGDNPKTLVPSENSPANQSPDGCSACPMNVFGSAGNGKACKNVRMLAVLPPDADDDTPMWTLKVSPTGLKSFDGYVNNVARTIGTSPVGVVTTVSLDPNADYPTLRFGDPQPNENVAVHFARQEEAREMVNAEPDLTQRTQAPAKAPARPAARKAVAARR
ncbi:hypothetical protein QTI66_32630 [Variovorax sp. J22R133]|uniref:hypothetical protein n=1 Tax=Variovorax brevis TaxID=3053503 RepID=UPI002575CBD4|nr:hypothetical protein [Variovorax sp. J22R133]MDM0116874.1 hypothetical protein [Variovorax sp. J22R133]